MIKSELGAIETLEYKEQALKVYHETLSMTKVLARVAELKEFAKVQEEKPKEEPKEEPANDPKEWVKMEICLSATDFDKFDEWTKANGIDWRLR